LLKPLTYDKLEDTLNPFLRKFRGEARKLPLMVERTPLYIPYSDLYYLSSVMRQTEVHLEKKVLKQSSAINFQKTVAPLLSDSRFFLCSKGIIVNLQHVSELEKDHFVLNNGEEVPISRRNLSQAKKTFLDFSLNQ
jgi:DNA-binding LytR/AlgR family response regulator